MKWKAYSQRSWYRGDWPRPRPYLRLKWILILLFIYLVVLMWRLARLSTSSPAEAQESKRNEVSSPSNTDGLIPHENQPVNSMINQQHKDDHFGASQIDRSKSGEDDSRTNKIENAKKDAISENRDRIIAEREKRAATLRLRKERLKQNNRNQGEHRSIVDHRNEEFVNVGSNKDIELNNNELQSNEEESPQLIPTSALIEEQLAVYDWNKHVMPPIFSNTSQQVDHPWLLITIPTVARARPYLALVLSAIANQLPRSNYIQVAVVHNIHPDRKNYSHETYEIEREFRKKDPRFHFIDLVNTLPVLDGSEKGTRNIPGEKVRAQTRDLVNTLTLVHNQFNPKYMMFMEDDFLLCKEGLSAFVYIIRRMNEQWNSLQGWNLVRFSFGFNGFILQRDDIQTLADYLLKHQLRRPPDHLLVEWFAGETDESAADKRGRVHAAYRYNLLDHMGQHSTLRDGIQPNYMRCWQPLTFPTIFEVEVFKNECAMQNSLEDLWPCSGAAKVCRPWTFVSRSASLM